MINVDIVTLFTTSFVAIFAALFPVVNPLGAAPIFLNLVQGCSTSVKNKLARSVAINAFILLLGSMLVGPKLLLFFGISLPALKLAGGAVLIAMGWGLLNQKSSSSDSGNNSAEITDATASNNAFFPLTLPLTAGPGCIAISISLVAGYESTVKLDFIDQLPAIAGTLAALFALSLTIYASYKEGSSVLGLLGPASTNAVMRIFAFILLAIGVQIFLGGVEGVPFKMLSP